LPRVVELPTKRELLSKLNTPDLNTIFTSFDQNQIGQGAISTIQSSVIDQKKKFTQSDGSPFKLNTELIKVISENKEKLEKFAWFDNFRNQTEAWANDIQRDYEDLLASFDQLVKVVKTTDELLDSEQHQIEIDLNRVAEESESSDLKSMLSRRKSLSEDVTELQGIQDQITQKHQEILGLFDDRHNRIIPALNTARMKVTALRQEKLNDINTQLQDLTSTARVEISLLHQQERSSFILGLGIGNKKDSEGILKGVNKHYIADKYAEHYAKRHSPHTFVGAILNTSDTSRQELQISITLEDGSTKEIIPQDRAESVWRHLSPTSEDSQYFDAEKLKKLLELEHCETEDLVQISLDGRPIEGLSPGQRCSALIPVILLESHTPLVIDQPEDNLDNKLVFNLVVDIIRGLKEQRQIIMATHNPNIPVSGDAEQIVVYDTQSKEICERIVSGSIDCDEVVEHVKAIMEGSEEAFRIRAEKYGYELPAHIRKGN
jgi:hypothetical protein